MPTTTTYSFWGSLVKALVKGTVFAVPIVMTILPAAWLNITLGTALYMFLDYCQKTFTSL